MPDSVEVAIVEDATGKALYAVWLEGGREVRRERMGSTPREIGNYYRGLLAKDLHTSVGSPEYNAFVDRVFGGD